jgi:hypothetical protein
VTAPSPDGQFAAATALRELKALKRKTGRYFSLMTLGDLS